MSLEEAPDASMLDGDQEWDFYKKYWPSGPGIPAPPASEGSTQDPGLAAEEREPKAARVADQKGGQGRGGGDGKGFAGHAGQDSSNPKSPPGANKRQQRDQAAPWRGGGQMGAMGALGAQDGAPADRVKIDEMTVAMMAGIGLCAGTFGTCSTRFL